MALLGLRSNFHKNIKTFTTGQARKLQVHIKLMDMNRIQPVNFDTEEFSIRKIESGF